MGKSACASCGGSGTGAYRQPCQRCYGTGEDPGFGFFAMILGFVGGLGLRFGSLILLMGVVAVVLDRIVYYFITLNEQYLGLSDYQTLWVWVPIFVVLGYLLPRTVGATFSFLGVAGFGSWVFFRVLVFIGFAPLTDKLAWQLKAVLVFSTITLSIGLGVLYYGLIRHTAKNIAASKKPG